MNTPFPGMDPYLEHPSLWPAVHTRLLVAIANQLGPLLRPRYVASVEERVFLEGPQQQRIPDVFVQQVNTATELPPLAIQTAVATPLVVEVEEIEVREHFVEVLDRYQEMKVVAVIELLSPANKQAGPGRTAYLDKQRETLARECHLVEIDLLRTGAHTVSLPEAQALHLPQHDYLVCVSRFPQRKRFEVYPRALREPLPTFRVPLAEGDPDAPLNLQAALAQVYEEGSYMLRVRYDEPCQPPLTREDQQWASECWRQFREANQDLLGGA